jgi:hypothetical protein
MGNGAAAYEAGSGTYRFQSTLRGAIKRIEDERNERNFKGNPPYDECVQKVFRAPLFGLS